jgi:transposase
MLASFTSTDSESENPPLGNPLRFRAVENRSSCDGHGRPRCFVLTPGQTHDVHGFGPLFRMLEDRVEALLADKGYDADAIREEIEAAGVEAVIPAKSNRRVPIAHDREKYRWRNLVERLFSKLKNWRRVATRYDKTRESYLGFVAIASIKLWIPFVHVA